MDENFNRGVEKILEKDPRYPSGAYLFLSEAVTYTVKKLSRHAAVDGTRHVSGQELTGGFMDYAVSLYGFLSPDVLESWGVLQGRDVGNMVYNMIGEGLLSAGPGDRQSDFECHENLIGELRAKVDRALLLPDPEEKGPVLDL
ncbi:MAG: hypothetical protein J6S58_04840 [Lentisphaeria bacterium]|nr:hypothetical protein [Lentisphaeria bacterium]